MPRRSSSKRRWPRRLALAFVVLLVLLAWVLPRAGTALVVEHDIGSPDAILMLASHEWERLPATAALAREHPEAIVLLTRPRVVTIHNCHRCEERLEWLEAEGVAPDRVRILPGAANTYQEAQAARAYALQEPFTKLAVVTTPYHTRRALGAFRRVLEGSGIEVGMVPAAPAQGRPSQWWSTAYDRSYVRYEWAAILAYRLRHGVPLRTAVPAGASER